MIKTEKQGHLKMMVSRLKESRDNRTIICLKNKKRMSSNWLVIRTETRLGERIRLEEELKRMMAPYQRMIPPYQRMMASSTEVMPKRLEEEVDLKFDKYYNHQYHQIKMDRNLFI